MIRLIASLVILGLSLIPAAAQQRDDPRIYMDSLRERDRIIYGNPAANDRRVKDKPSSQPGYSQEPEPGVRQGGPKSNEESLREQGRDLYGRQIPKEELEKPRTQEEPRGYSQAPRSAATGGSRGLMDSLNQRDRILGINQGKPKVTPQRTYRDPGPLRQLMVTVTDERGDPVVDAEVTVVTAALGSFKEGNTSSLGSYLGAVRCYVPGIHDSLVHKVRVTSMQGLATQRFSSDSSNCELTANLNFVLQGGAGDGQDMLKQYRERQKRYEDEAPLAPDSPYRDPYQKDEIDPYEKRYPEPSFPGQYKPPGGLPGGGEPGQGGDGSY